MQATLSNSEARIMCTTSDLLLYYVSYAALAWDGITIRAKVSLQQITLARPKHSSLHSSKAAAFFPELF